jgi:hypothetical protein
MSNVKLRLENLWNGVEREGLSWIQETWGEIRKALRCILGRGN